jgi:hypothetical protein
MLRYGNTCTLIMAGVAGMASFAAAQPVIDGAGATTEYPAALWINGDNPTSFGDNQDPTIDCANGSEMDGIFATIEDDAFGDPTLYIIFTGNLETNFNKLDVFIDTIPGVGQNRLPDTNPDIDYGALLRMGDEGTGNGLTFDYGFTANMYFTCTVGNCDPTPAEVYANFANLDLQTGYYLGTTIPGDGFLTGGDNPFGIMCTVDNTNIDGVTDLEADPIKAAAVDTGFEISIPLFAMDDPTDDLQVCVFINGGGHDFISSQISNGGPHGVNHLGEPRTFNMAGLFGFQYVTVDNGNARAPLFTLHSNALTGGQRVTMQTTGGTPNQNVYFVYSLAGEGSVFVPQLGVNLGLKSPKLAGNSRADGDGVATFQKMVPGIASGRNVWLQAAEQGAATNVLQMFIN